MDCVGCGMPVPPDSRVCPVCGASVPGKRAGRVIVAGGCCGGILGAAVTILAFGYPLFSTTRQRAAAAECVSNVHLDDRGLLLYAQDYDEHMAPTRGWMDHIVGYLGRKNASALRCPEIVRIYDHDKLKYGYACNSAISLKPLGGFADPASTMTLYDSTDMGRNATDAGSTLVYRHRERATIGYLDGHAASIAGPKVE